MNLRCFAVAAALLWAKSVGAASVVVAGSILPAPTITCGLTTLLPTPDGASAGLILAQSCALAQQATIQSLSFYTTDAAGSLRMGIYDATGPSGGAGKLLAQTPSVVTKANNWNTTAVVTPVLLSPGTYWLAYESDNHALTYLTGGGTSHYATQAFGNLPAAFPALAGSWTAWSFYATLTPAAPPPPTLSVTFNPSNPSIPANAAAGTIVAAVVPTWSNGQQFTESMAFSSPFNNDGGTFALDANHNLIVSGNALSVDGGTIQNVSITVTQ
jgi:hypothetical protein